MRIISGMHRSGTSLVAQCCLEAGADLGDPETFYPADKWNTDGYFEQLEVLAINLRLVHGPFWKFAYFRLPSTATILKRAAQRADEIHRVSERYDGKIVKETRFCLTLPAWTRYGVRVDKVLICLRSPFSVASSIRKRNRVSLKRGYDLWFQHNERLLENVRGLDTWFVSYEKILDPESFGLEVSPAIRFLGLDADERLMDTIRKKVVKPQMNRNPQSETEYPRHVAHLWRELCRMHAAQFEPQPSPPSGL